MAKPIITVSVLVDVALNWEQATWLKDHLSKPVEGATHGETTTQAEIYVALAESMGAFVTQYQNKT